MKTYTKSRKSKKAFGFWHNQDIDTLHIVLAKNLNQAWDLFEKRAETLFSNDIPLKEAFEAIDEIPIIK